jgi:hypothetical protein
MLRSAIALLVLMIATVFPVLAQGNLSQEERGFVIRNPMLATLQQDDPGAFRKLLALLSAQAEKTRQPPASRQRQIPLRKETDFDLSGNPDLQELQKSSPEAAHELFQVLKQAGALKPKKN